ncbi:hypothetical protein PHYNN_211 [Pantoea phage Phynn]|nr:hypothetical protein PHYNN_211 [Pantoea phage Phynn]
MKKFLKFSPEKLEQMRAETAGTYAEMSTPAFAVAGITLNPDRLPSVALAQIVERYAERIEYNPDAKWLTVDADGDIFMFRHRPEQGELHDMWHESINEPVFSELTGTIPPSLKKHLRLETNWREYIIEVNQ